MKQKYLVTTVVLLLLISGFGYYLYDYNKEFERAQIEHQKNIENIKSVQKNIDENFIISQQEKETAIYQQQTSLRLKDDDGDGLTYEEEIRLGTSDNQKDSDGDGVNDNEDKHPAGGGENYKFNVKWTHKSLQYTTQFGIAEDKYWYYKNKERGYCCDGWNNFATPTDPIIQTIAKDITDVSISTGDTCKSCIAIDFVESMIYEYDIDYISRNEYPKYPIETIVDGKGDCEDTSFLMASILEAINIDTILLLFSDHAAVGVWCEGCTGTYYNYNGRKYFFLETTGYADNWDIGKSWGKYKTESPKIINI